MCGNSAGCGEICGKGAVCGSAQCGVSCEGVHYSILQFVCCNPVGRKGSQTSFTKKFIFLKIWIAHPLSSLVYNYLFGLGGLPCRMAGSTASNNRNY